MILIQRGLEILTLKSRRHLKLERFDILTSNARSFSFGLWSNHSKTEQTKWLLTLINFIINNNKFFLYILKALDLPTSGFDYSGDLKSAWFLHV